MLSDETATSKNSKNTINWLNNYLNTKNIQPNINNSLKIEEIIFNLKNQTLVLEQ